MGPAWRAGILTTLPTPNVPDAVLSIPTSINTAET